MNRPIQFLRSVLPVDRFQLFFLAGLVCLTIAPRLRWWPTYLAPEVRNRLHAVPSAMDATTSAWLVLAGIFSLGFILTASAGYLFCLWPPKHPVRQILLLVALPTIVALSGIVAMDAVLRAPFKSVLSPRMVQESSLNWRVSDVWQMGTGLHFAVAGLLLTGLFLVRLILRESSLPLQLSPPVNEGESLSGWVGCKRVIWFSVAACTGIIWRGPQILFALLPGVPPPRSALLGQAMSVLTAAVVLAIALWLMGAENRQVVRGLLRFTGVNWLLVAIALPTVVTVAAPMTLYLWDRAFWAAHYFGRLDPPLVGEYLHAPPLWAISLPLVEFLEEVIFRGILQPYFVKRYGIWRGFFLVGLIWSAYHFYGDRYPSGADYWVLLGLARRVAICLVLSFILSWLTVRSESLWPATVLHWFSNIGIYAMHRPPQDWWRVFAWAVAACILYKFWALAPPDARVPEIAGSELPNVARAE